MQNKLNEKCCIIKYLNYLKKIEVISLMNHIWYLNLNKGNELTTHPTVFVVFAAFNHKTKKTKPNINNNAVHFQLNYNILIR